MFTKKFLLDMGERALKTFAQAAVAVIVANQAVGVNVLKAAAIAGVLSVVTSFASTLKGSKDSASVIQ